MILLEDRGMKFGTIHSVKGESFDAVLLILKHGGFQDKHYVTHFDNGSHR